MVYGRMMHTISAVAELFVSFCCMD